MDKRRGLLNVSIAIIFRIVILIGSILVRRYLIRYIGNEINGLNSLYASILDFLAVAELGVGSAITFCMYKPIVEGDINKVSALYGLFKKLYLIIGGIILVCGCAIMPALKYIAKDYQSVEVNLYLTFGLTLASVVLTYAFSAKTSLINAYKNNFITTTITSAVSILQYGLQIIILITTGSFVWFLVCRIGSALMQWGITEIIARRKYGEIISNKQRIGSEEKNEVTKNIKAMFMHKIGAVLVNTADSLIISAFIGLVVLGKYSNYITIMTGMTGVVMLCFSPLTSVIGHMFVEESKEQSLKYFNFFHSFNFVLGLIFFLGYYAVIDNLVNILFKNGLELAKSISFVITLNYFIQFMEQAVRLFKDSSGMFYYDRWKCIFEGMLNVGLSILFVLVFPQEYNVVGVIVATIITNLFVCHTVEPHILFKYALKVSAKNYYIRNYIYIGIFAGALTALHYSMISSTSQWAGLFVNGGISLAYSLGLSAVIVVINKDFRNYVKIFFARLFKNKSSNEAVGATEIEESSERIITNENKNDNIK